MNTLFLLFSHTLTDEQFNDAVQNFKIDNMVYFPDELLKKWSDVPPYGDIAEDYLDDIKNYIMKNKTEKNYVLVEGEYGLTYMMVNWCFKNGFIPIYSTTARNYTMEFGKDGEIVSKHLFKHVKFRLYKKE